MSTRSMIAVINQDGTGQFIYCHCDGYPEWNGRLLLHKYPTRKDAMSIIRMGDLASLGKSLKPKADFDDDARHEGTNAHHRDWERAWKECQPRQLKEGLAQFDRTIKESDSLYGYAFVGGCWMCCIDKQRIWKSLLSVEMRVDLPDPFEDDDAVNQLEGKPYKECTLEELKVEFRSLAKTPNLITVRHRECIVAEVARRGFNPHDVL